MSLDVTQLNTALGRFTSGVVDLIDETEASVKADMDALIIGLTDEYGDSQTIIEGGSTELPTEPEKFAINEKYSDMGESNVIDASIANHYSKIITGATTLSVTNVRAEHVTTFILHLTNPGELVTLWPNISWSEGIEPQLTVTGRDVLAFSTFDGGVTWDGYLIGSDMKPSV